MVAAILAHLKRQTYEVKKGWSMPKNGWRRMGGVAEGVAGDVVVVQEQQEQEAVRTVSSRGRLGSTTCHDAAGPQSTINRTPAAPPQNNRRSRRSHSPCGIF